MDITRIDMNFYDIRTLKLLEKLDMAEKDFNSEKINSYYKGLEKDSSYVDKVFCDDEKKDELHKLLSKQFDELLPEDDSEKKDLDHILYRIHYDINTRLSTQKISLPYNIIRWTLRIAGVMILPLIIFIGIKNFKETNLQKESWVEIKAPAWTRAQFGLPDGTTGWLNSNSSVRYSGNFVSERQVYVKGEAFFDVFKNEEKPFTVNTDEVVIKVLGTRFNISSYDNENNVEVVLEEGKLELVNKELSKTYTMKPNDLVVYNKVLKDISTEVVQPQKYLSWTEGKLIFRNDPMDIVARRLERWYNIEVETKGCVVKDLRWRATFIDEGLEEVLELLKRSLPVNYKIVERDIKSDDTYAKRKVIIYLQDK